MSLQPSQKRTREGPLLVLALAMICGITIPLFQLASSNHEAAMAEYETKMDQWKKDEETAKQNGTKIPDKPKKPEKPRIATMLLGPEQIACYCCFSWGILVLMSRYLEVRRQCKVFALDLLPTEEGTRILPEDARPLLRKTEQMTRGKPYILSNMIRLALSKYAISRSGQDVTETLQLQSDIEMGRMVSSMSMVHYLAWAIPAIGFLGTVRGLGLALEDPTLAIRGLYIAFDVTLVALCLSLPLMFVLHKVQRDEEAVVIDCQQYCLEHLVARLYDVETEHAPA